MDIRQRVIDGCHLMKSWKECFKSKIAKKEISEQFENMGTAMEQNAVVWGPVTV